MAAPLQSSETTETLLRAAAYDKNLDARTPEGLRLGVVFDPKVPDSQANAELFTKHAAALESEIVTSFKIARSHKISFAILRIDDHGDKAQARVRRADTLVTRDGQTIVAGSIVDFSFQKRVDGAWVYDSMANAAPLS